MGTVFLKPGFLRFFLLIGLFSLWGCSGMDRMGIEGNSDSRKLLKKEILKYHELLEKNPQDWSVHTALGWAQLDAKQYRYSIESFNSALKLNPEDAIAYMGLGMTYEKVGDFAYAVESYQKAADIRPDWHKPYYQLGRVYNALGDSKKTMEMLHILVKTDDHFAKQLMEHIY